MTKTYISVIHNLKNICVIQVVWLKISSKKKYLFTDKLPMYGHGFNSISISLHLEQRLYEMKRHKIVLFRRNPKAWWTVQSLTDQRQPLPQTAFTEKSASERMTYAQRAGTHTKKLFCRSWPRRRSIFRCTNEKVLN